jgi:riboflavin synthase
MFTGLVEAVGEIEQIRRTEAGLELRIGCPFTDLAPGESIAVNGACLTVRTFGAGWFTAAAITATLSLTTIGDWDVGRRVNLERAMRPTDRLGGHIVQGHVDGVGTVVKLAREGDQLAIDVEVPEEVAELLVPHGSVAVDGVSLTVQALPAPRVVRVAIIEFTERHTSLGTLTEGDRVHLESDVIGKFVRTLLDRRSGA